MLKATLKTLDGLDDSLKALYAETDGTFTLQVEGMVTDAEVNGLKTALVKEREAHNSFKKFGTPDEITAKIADLETKAASKGAKDADHQAIIDQMKAEHAAELQSRDEKFTKSLRTTAIANLKAELAKSGVIPDAIEYAAQGLASRLRIDADGTQTIMTADGASPMIGTGANGGATFADIAKELATSQPFIFADAGKGGGGKPPNSDGGKPQSQSMSVTDFNALDPKTRAAAMADGLTLTE